MMQEKKENNMSQKELNDFLISALYNGAEPPTIRELLKRGAQAEFFWEGPASKRGETPLMIAMARTKFFSVIEMLVQNGGRLDISDSDGDTPLFYAMYNRNFCIAKKAVLKLGANANHQNKKGQTPLMIGAMTVEHIADAKDFLEWGFDFNTVDNKGRDAFLYAVKENRSENNRQSIVAWFASVLEDKK